MLVKLNNNIIKELKKQKREKSYLLFLDNLKIIKDALSIGLNPIYILTIDEKLLNSEFDNYKGKIFLIDKKSLEQLSDSKTPYGVLCIIEYHPNTLIKPNTNFLVLDGLQDPGNVGSLIRTAAACGFNYVYLIESVKVTNSKVIRSSVGTIFNINIIETNRKEFIKKVSEWNIKLLKADMKGTNIFKFSNNEQIGIVIGNEGQGVSKELSDLCKLTVSIPMKNKVESLNASVSGSIIMYEISKNNFDNN